MLQGLQGASLPQIHILRAPWSRNLAGDKTDGTRVWGSDEDVVQADLAEEGERACEAGALLHQQRRSEHEGAQVQVPPHARLPHIPALSNASVGDTFANWSNSALW